MRKTRQGWGLVGALLVSGCCLGGGPILAATAAALGLGSLHSILNIGILGPVMIVSVAWVCWNLARQARALGRRAPVYAPFVLALGGGVTAVIGVWLPHLLAGTGPAKVPLIAAGTAVLLAGSLAALLDQRRQRRRGRATARW